MAGVENLVPMNKRTKAKQKQIATAGGKASGVARRKKRTLREIAEMIGNMEVKNPKTKAILEAAGFEGTPTNDDAAFFGIMLKAQNGDAACMKLLAEMRGQYSTRVEVEPVQPKPLIDLTNTIEAETKDKE